MIYTFTSASPQQGYEALLQLTAPQGDPFVQDWVVCPHPESARWVSQQLALARGVRTQLEIYPTSRWVNELQATLWPRATQQPPVSRFTWAVIQGGARLARDLEPTHELARLFRDSTLPREGEDAKRAARRRGRALAGRRLRAAQHLARQLRRLLLTRPHWLQAWDRLSEEQIKQSLKLPAHETPWPALWREVSRSLGPVEHRAHTKAAAQRPVFWSDWLEELCKRASQQGSPLTRKVRRIILFGHHRYDAQTLALARACSESVEVGLITIDPRACAPQHIQRRLEAPESASLVGAPIYDLFGRGFTAHQGLRQSGHDDEVEESSHQVAWASAELLPDPPFPVSLPSPQQVCPLSPELTTPHTLLHTLQADLSRDRDRPEAPREVRGDLYSLRFHASYSEQRQVEDLYQTLLGAFRRDPTLRPRDVLVLCPDIERFSPLILAVFNGGSQEDELAEAREQRAEKSSTRETQAASRLGAEIARPHGHNPFAGLLTSLISLVGSRLYRYDVFELLKHPLVSAKFSLSLSEILKLEQWTRESGVRWGLDDEHRAACGLGGEAHHTWTFGLDRLLMGTLMGAEEGLGARALYMGVAPMSVGDQAEEQLLSRFLAFFSNLRMCRTQLRDARLPAEWCELLIDALHRLTATPGSEARALRQDVEADLARALKRGAPTKQRLTPRAVSALIEESVGKQRAVIGGGRDHVRFYPLDQAYSVSARVVCLLDLSEGAFPIRHRPDPRDPRSLSPLPTDLDLMHEQHCNALSSLLAAREQCHMFYTGQKSGGELRAPAPLVLAIQEELKGRYQLDDLVGDRLIEALTTLHPLHSFSARNFVGDAQGAPTEETLSHDPLWLEGATAWRDSLRDPKAPPSFANRGLDVATRGVSRPRVDTLRQLLKNPSEFFLKRGVGMNLVRDEEISRERELLELNQLQAWSLKDRMFHLLKTLDESTEQAYEDDEVIPAESSSEPLDWGERGDLLMGVVRAEGLLPVGRMGEVSFEQTLSEVRSLYERFNRARDGAPPTNLSLTVPLPSGRSMRLEGDKRYGERLIFTTPSNHQERGDEQPMLRGDRLIEPWLYHVALSASGVPYEGTTLVARDGDFQDFPPLTMRRATELLERWSDLLEDGALRPLRFDPGLSWRWASALARGESEAEAWSELQEAGSKWRRADDEYIRQVFGGREMWGAHEAPSSGARGDEQEREPSLNGISANEKVDETQRVNESSDLPPHVPADESQSVALSVHPDFSECAHVIFGDLASALMSAQSSEESTL